MPAASGIHAHPFRKLGRRPPKNASALRLADIRTGVVPAHPLAADHLHGTAFGMYGNNSYGDCGPTSVANLRRLVIAALGGGAPIPSQDDVFDLYRRSGNPHFDPATDADDNGVDMQTMLEALLSGGIGGVKPVAFAKVDVTNDDELEAAVAIFGGVLWGVDLETAQQTQTDRGLWDYRRSGEWGGHAVLDGQYGVDVQSVVTWAEVVGTTDAFRRHQLQEAWVIAWEENFGTTQFEQGIDVDALASAYQQITGKTLPLPGPAPVPVPTPVPAPAPPVPAPVPNPRPMDEVDLALWTNVRDWAHARHTTSNKHAAQYVLDWAQAHGYL